MGVSWIRIGVADSGVFKKAVSSLGVVDESMPGWLHADIAAEVSLVKDKAAKRILDEATHGSKHTGLRESISKGLKVVPYVDALGTGVEIVSEMPIADMRGIPKGLDTQLRPRGWRHPVFGNTKKWVAQKGDLPWFSENIEEALPELEVKIAANLTKAVQLIKGL